VITDEDIGNGAGSFEVSEPLCDGIRSYSKIKRGDLQESSARELRLLDMMEIPTSRLGSKLPRDSCPNTPSKSSDTLAFICSSTSG